MMDCGVSATSVHPGGIKTAIARKSVTSPEIEEFTGADPESGKELFEKSDGFLFAPGSKVCYY